MRSRVEREQNGPPQQGRQANRQCRSERRPQHHFSSAQLVVVAHAKSSYGRILDAVKLTASRFTRRDFLVEGRRMNERPVPSRGPEVGRWLMVAAGRG